MKKMIKGMIVFTFNEKVGMNLEAKFPSDINADPNLLMRIYTIHFSDKSINYFSFSVESLNIVSIYTGPETDLYISIFLEEEDDPGEFREILEYAGGSLLDKLSKNRYIDLLPGIYSRIVHLYKKKIKA